MAFDDIINGINKVQNALNGANNPLSDVQRNQFKSDGFALPASFSADGNGLPYSKVPSSNEGQIKRNIITWFVPEFGIVRMYVNPNAITYTHKKIINKDMTKGGYSIQYWGEELTDISINGTTGSSGIEGINMLYEVYRAEQYAFDGIGLTLDANNAAADLSSNLVNGIGGIIGGSDATAVAGASGLLGGILGLDSPNNNLSPKNIPSLGQLAISVEMYYNGWVYRGFFESMSIQERAENFLFEYQIKFTATQRRGYRTNYFPFHRSANNGPSQYDTPHSFDRNKAGVIQNIPLFPSNSKTSGNSQF
jgi:hypothetical protein